MDDLKTKLLSFHPIHALGFGVLGGFIGQKYGGYDFKKTTAIVGIGTYAYMNTYGHTLTPWKNNDKTQPKVYDTSGIVLYTDPEKTKQVQPNSTSTPIFDSDYYDGFDDRLKDALQKGYTNLNDYVAEHKSDANLGYEIYTNLGIQI
jgi:hypothetical protein